MRLQCFDCKNCHKGKQFEGKFYLNFYVYKESAYRFCRDLIQKDETREQPQKKTERAFAGTNVVPAEF